MQNYNKNKKQFEKYQSKRNFEKLYRKPLKDNVIVKSEHAPLCKVFTKSLNETKSEYFKKNGHKKISFFW